MSALLVGDVGGTHARFGRVVDGELGATWTVPTAGSGGLSGALAVSAQYGEFSAVSVAVAGPVEGRRARLTNTDWSADLDALGGLDGPDGPDGLDGLLLNDLEAAAWGVGAGGALSAQPLYGTPSGVLGDAAVMGVGTGLGEALWIGGRAVAGEGGHATFGPANAEQAALLGHLLAQLGRPVEWEDVLSGPGLGRIARWLGGPGAARWTPVLGEAADSLDDVALGRAAVEHQGTAIGAACAALFWSLVAAEARNLALRTLPGRGVFVVGGLAPRLLPRFDAAAFAAAFVGEGPLAWRLVNVPVQLVLDDGLALRGAAAAYAAARGDGWRHAPRAAPGDGIVAS